jgi:hypothetical protein
MADFDRRKEALNPVARIEVPQITIGSAVTTEVTDTINANMRVKQIVVKVNNTTNSITFTVELRDDDGAVLWSQASINENAKTVFQYYTLSDTDLPLNILLQGTITVGVTPSGAPGASTGLVDVKLYGD